MNTQAVIPSPTTQLRQGQEALRVLLGMPPSTLSDLGPSGIPVSPPQIIVGIPADLLRRRPDVRSAEIADNVRVQDAQFQQLLLNCQNTVLSAQQDVEDNLPASREPRSAPRLPDW